MIVAKVKKISFGKKCQLAAVLLFKMVLNCLLPVTFAHEKRGLTSNSFKAATFLMSRQFQFGHYRVKPVIRACKLLCTSFEIGYFMFLFSIARQIDPELSFFKKIFL